jgi:hypothetical protein
MTKAVSELDLRRLQGELNAAKLRVRELEDEVRDTLEALGRRPGDGSDQPALFQAEAQSRLF